jgi:hypothetical protein
MASERDEEDAVRRVQLGRRIDKMVRAEMFDGGMHQRQRHEEAGSKLRWPGSWWMAKEHQLRRAARRARAHSQGEPDLGELLRGTSAEEQFSMSTWNRDMGNFTYTTGIRGFTECRPLCRVPFVGHWAKKALPRAALGKVRLSATSLFTECWTLGTGPHSATTRLPSVKHSAKVALGKGPSAAVPELTAVSLCREPRVGTRQRVFFAECQIVGTRQSTLCWVSSLDTRQNIFLFF